MRATLLDWLPQDLRGQRILDAGCGPGVMSLELARRGGHVVGVDLSSDLITVARERAAESSGDWPSGAPDFRVGDFVEVAREGFDWVVSMDCLIHYPLRETLEALRAVEDHVTRGLLVTVAPWTPLLGLMHGLGKVFPRGDRAPGIVPVKDGALRSGLAGPFGIRGFTLHRTHTVHSGFYISRALELTRRAGEIR
jgi:magnesium-protoporphyrin O-methyltransferase